MTQEEKQLLLKDLCARLPYFLYVECYDKGKECFVEGRMKQIDFDTSLIEVMPPEMEKYKPAAVSTWADLESVKPYLRPISSMTDEEKKSYHIIKDRLCEACIHGSIKDIAYWTNSLDLWFYEYHFDNANLIEKGLALEAPEDMYK